MPYNTQQMKLTLPTSAAQDTASGNSTPSTVDGIFAEPQWARLMPEASEMQDRKLIHAVQQDADSDDEQEDVASSADVQRWQSDNDLPERRVMVHRIVAITQRRPLSPTDSARFADRVPALAKRIELSLYSRASSLDEYKNLSTLRRRIQSLIAISFHEMAAARTVKAPSPVHAIAGKRRFASRHLDLEDHSMVKRQCKPFDMSPVRRAPHSGRIFASISDDSVRNIFSYLEGQEVIGHRLINRYAAVILPSCVISLRVEIMSLKTVLSAGAKNMVSQMANLEKLVVYKRMTSKTAVIAADAHAKAMPLHAWGCSELNMMQQNDGEAVVKQLSHALDSGLGRRLKQLHLVSVFTNTAQRNGLRSLCLSLSRGSCPQLEDLLLGGNSITDLGMADIATLLGSKAASQLTRLDLRRNYIGESGVHKIASALAQGQSKQLKYLCIGGNLITDNCVPSLTDLLAGSACPQLCFLGLEDNFLSPEGVQTIMHAAMAGGLVPKLHRVAAQQQQQ